MEVNPGTFRGRPGKLPERIGERAPGAIPERCGNFGTAQIAVFQQILGCVHFCRGNVFFDRLSGYICLVLAKEGVFYLAQGLLWRLLSRHI